MKKITYMCPFRNDQIAGGTKVAYRHVEMLRTLGFDAAVFTQTGHPIWFKSTAPILDAQRISTDSNSVLVFSEDLNGNMVPVAQRKVNATKAFFCQNQYYSFSEAMNYKNPLDLDFENFLTVGQVAKGFLDRVYSPARFDVIPVWIDEAIFFPRAKGLSVAVIPRKLRFPYRVIGEIFSRKYPALSQAVTWNVIDNVSEGEAYGEIGCFPVASPS